MSDKKIELMTIYGFCSLEEKVAKLEKRNKSLTAQLSTLKRKYADIKRINPKRRKEARIDRAKTMLLNYINGDRTFTRAQIGEKFHLSESAIKNELTRMRKELDSNE